MRMLLVMLLCAGCASTGTPVLTLPKVEIVEVPAPAPIPESEDWVEAVYQEDGFPKGGVLMGDGKALRCGWYKIEFDRFSALYQAEAQMRSDEHVAVVAYQASVSESDTWLTRNEFVIGGALGLAIGVGISILVAFAAGQ